MKVKTNLTADELELVSRGLSSLAKSQRADGKFVPSNPAEKELLEEVDSAVDTMLGHLSREVATLFRGE